MYKTKKNNSSHQEKKYSHQRVNKIIFNLHCATENLNKSLLTYEVERFKNPDYHP
jgi:hypothetical protein